MTEEEHRRKIAEEEYSDFIKGALSVGFTDDQADWLWENCRRTWTDLDAH